MSVKRWWIFSKGLAKSVGSSGLGAIKNFSYFNQWNDHLSHGRNSMVDEQPWMTFPAIEFIKNHLKATDRVFEFGGGGSTLFFLKHSQQTVTVEHDAQWFTLLKDAIQQKGLHNWEGILQPPEKNTGEHKRDIANPNDYCSDDVNYKGYNFQQYASSIDKYPDSYFDWVVVDGRARPSCIMHGLQKVKINGYLVLDNSDRAYYLANTSKAINEKFELILDAVAPIPYHTFFSKTTIWLNKR